MPKSRWNSRRCGRADGGSVASSPPGKAGLALLDEGALCFASVVGLAQGTAVSLASDDVGILKVAEADGDIAPLITALTRPDNAEQLSLFGR